MIRAISRVRCRLTSLLLVALFVRAVVPVGFMLVSSPTDIAGVTVVICSAQGQTAMTLDEDGSATPSGTKASHHSCPYAASALPGVVSPVVQLSSNVEYAAVAYTLSKLRFNLTPLPGAVSARGPPELV